MKINLTGGGWLDPGTVQLQFTVKIMMILHLIVIFCQKHDLKYTLYAFRLADLLADH